MFQMGPRPGRAYPDSYKTLKIYFLFIKVKRNPFTGGTYLLITLRGRTK